MSHFLFEVCVWLEVNTFMFFMEFLEEEKIASDFDFFGKTGKQPRSSLDPGQ